jgi:uncharacterized cupin superfamily protein
MFITERPAPAVVRASEIPWEKLPAREGIFSKSMTFGDATTRRYLYVQVGKTGPQAASPRHKHTFDQLRYFIEGDAKYGNTIYHPGDCVYFPEGVPYGPQVGYNDADSIQIVLQFSGPSGIYYPSGDEQAAAKRALDADGEFRSGVYHPRAGKPRDGFEALLEHITGAPVAYAAPRYDAPIRMRTAAYTATPDPRDARIVRRHLARFNECGPDVVVATLQPGATLASEVPAADRLTVLISGEAVYRGAAIEGIACLHVPYGMTSEALVARTECTLLIVTFG